MATLKTKPYPTSGMPSSEGPFAFNIRMQKNAGLFPKELASVFVQKIAMTVLMKLVEKTPVDTGRARGNWQVTLNQPAEGYDESEIDKNGGNTFTKGSMVIDDAPEYPIIWITNNVPYIQRLEEGHSGQASTGMMQNTINEMNGMGVDLSSAGNRA